MKYLVRRLLHSFGLDLRGIANPQLEIKFGQQALEPARKPGRIPNETPQASCHAHGGENQLEWTFENLDKAVHALGDAALGDKLVMGDNRKTMQVDTHASRKRQREEAETAVPSCSIQVCMLEQAKAAIRHYEQEDSKRLFQFVLIR